VGVANLLSAVSANTTGPVVGLGTPYGNLTVSVTTTGTVSELSVQVLGSLDSFNWQDIGSAITSATAGESIGTGALFSYFRATLSGYSGTGTITCNLAYSLEGGGNAATATAAAGLGTTSSTVVVSGATAPVAAQVLTATSGTAADWQYPPADWFNVKNYGTGLGSGANATSAINAAITACQEAGGGTVYIPEGLYTISSSLLVGGGNPGALTIRGSGWNSQLQLTSGANCYIFDTGSSGSPQYTNGLVIADLYLDCNGANQTADSGAIYGRGSVWGVFEHLWIDQPYNYGVRFYQDGLGHYGHHNRLFGCKFTNGNGGGVYTPPSGALGIALYFDNADENSCHGCTFQDNGTSTYPATQVYDTGSGRQSFSGCTWVTTQTTSASMFKTNSSPSGCQITGCQFDSATTGNLLEINGPDCVIVGNEFLSFGQGSGSNAAIHLSSTYTQVTSNGFTPAGSNGIAVQETGTALTGVGYNVISGCSLSGSYYESAPVVLVSGDDSVYVTYPLPVAYGGTGDTSLTAYAPLAGGTTSTGAVQSASTGMSTSGNVLTSTGSSSLPTFQSLPTASTSSAGIVELDGTAGDIQASPGTAAAGSKGQAADAQHVHPQPPMFAPAGLTGATGSSAYAGATASGAPTSGTWAVGQWTVDQTGSFWICTTAGTAGSGAVFTQVASGGTAASFAPTGLTGATASSAYAGATTSGAPTSGTWSVGQWTVDRTGAFWICTTAGVAGSGVVFTQVAGSGGTLSNPMSSLGDMIYGGSSGAADRLGGNTSSTKEVPDLNRQQRRGDGAHVGNPRRERPARGDDQRAGRREALHRAEGGHPVQPHGHDQLEPGDDGDRHHLRARGLRDHLRGDHRAVRRSVRQQQLDHPVLRHRDTAVERRGAGRHRVRGRRGAGVQGRGVVHDAVPVRVHRRPHAVGGHDVLV
jgi:hypothetical protein